MTVQLKTQFLRQKMARHLVSSSVEEEGNNFVKFSRQRRFLSPQSNTKVMHPLLSCQVQAGRIHLLSILMTLPWGPAHDAPWETKPNEEGGNLQ